MTKQKTNKQKDKLNKILRTLFWTVLVIGCALISIGIINNLNQTQLSELESTINSSIQNATINASIQGYIIRNEEQLKEINNYNMTYIFGFANNQTYRLKLVPNGEWELVTK